MDDVDEYVDSDDSSSDESNINEYINKVEECKIKLKNNNLDYEAHVELISTYKKLGELEDARKSRENMNTIFPLSPELWMEWVKDEQNICSTEDERKYIESLFEKAVNEYMSVKVWVEYIMFILGGGNHTKTRDICDRALTAVGIHMADGELVWQATYLVEQQHYASLESEKDKKKLEDQKKKIQNLFRRQSRVPLMNLEKEEFISEAAKWFPDGIVDKNIFLDFDKSYKAMKERLPFEEALLRASDETEKLEAFRKYIDFTKEKDNPAVIQNVYERTVATLCLNAGLWEEFVRFVMDQFSFSDFVVLPVCERSQLNCPWSGVLCNLHITALQRFAETLGVEETDKRISGAVKKVVESGVTVGSELVKSWMAYLFYLRLKIDWDEKGHEKHIDKFRNECEYAMKSVDLCCGEEGDIDCEIARFQARIEAESARYVEGTRIIWNDHIMKRNQNFKNATMWLEFIELERSYGNLNKCRKLFKRALERVWDYVEVIGAAYLRFEQQVGTLETMTDFEQRYSARLAVVNQKRLEEAMSKDKEKYRNKKDSPKKTNYLKTNTNVPEKKTTKPSSSTIKDEANTKKSKIAPPPGYKRKADQGAEENSSKKAKVEEAPTIHGIFVKHDSSLDIRSVFLSNMDYQTEDKEILPIFADCGPIETLRITRDFKGRSKGFGYLIFNEIESVSKALKLDRTPINTRPLFVSKCNPKEREHAFKFPTTVEKEKLFVRGLPFSMKEDDIKKDFEPHGKIKSLRLVTHRNGYSKGNCYIDYFDSETAAKVVKAMDGKMYDELKLSVAISDPSAAKANKQSQFSRPAFVPSQASTSRQRPKLSFVPRALMKKPEEKSNSNGTNDPETKPKSNQDFRNLFLK